MPSCLFSFIITPSPKKVNKPEPATRGAPTLRQESTCSAVINLYIANYFISEKIKDYPIHFLINTSYTTCLLPKTTFYKLFTLTQSYLETEAPTDKWLTTLESPLTVHWKKPVSLWAVRTERVFTVGCISENACDPQVPNRFQPSYRATRQKTF